MVVFDLNERATFESVRQWMRMIDGDKNKDNIMRILVGNKADEDRRSITREVTRTARPARRLSRAIWPLSRAARGATRSASSVHNREQQHVVTVADGRYSSH
jgi:GTPase SAR1 family protein